MKKHKSSTLVLALIMAFIAAGLFLPRSGGAGDLEPPPDAVDLNGPVPTMRTLEEIDQKLDLLLTLEEIDRKLDLLLTISRNLATRRFEVLGDGTVLDYDTGLFWDRNANRFPDAVAQSMDWYDANAACDGLADDGTYADLTDGSKSGDWRLPTILEFTTLIDTRFIGPALSDAEGTLQWSEGDPFIEGGFSSAFAIAIGAWWSATEHSLNPNNVETINFYEGFIGLNGLPKASIGGWVWCVRNQ